MRKMHELQDILRLVSGWVDGVRLILEIGFDIIW